MRFGADSQRPELGLDSQDPVAEFRKHQALKQDLAVHAAEESPSPKGSICSSHVEWGQTSITPGRWKVALSTSIAQGV